MYAGQYTIHGCYGYWIPTIMANFGTFQFYLIFETRPYKQKQLIEHKMNRIIYICIYTYICYIHEDVEKNYHCNFKRFLVFVSGWNISQNDVAAVGKSNEGTPGGPSFGRLWPCGDAAAGAAGPRGRGKTRCYKAGGLSEVKPA